jgi:hypothetical protein
MFTYILFALIIILLICVIYWAMQTQRDKARRALAEDCIQASSGTYDKAARVALHSLTEIANPRAPDYFRRGNIIRYNILGGDVDGDNRAHRAAITNVMRDYTDTLLNVGGEPGAGYMIDQIVDFDRILGDAEGVNDALLAHMLFDLQDFHTVVAQTAPAARREIAEERIARTTATAPTRAAAIAEALDDATQFTSNAQNVHDSKINGDLRATLARLKADAGGFPPSPKRSIQEASHYIDNEYAADSPDVTERRERAQRVLNKVKEGGRIDTFGDTEDNIFAHVWDRTKDTRNRTRATLMREAVDNALADSVEKGNEVCINGRCAHLLNSLVTLDHDPAMGAAMTFEAYKNQIYQETKQIVADELSRARTGDSPALRDAAAIFEAGDMPDPANKDVVAADQQFRAEVKAAISSNIDTYSEKLSPAERTVLKDECHVYATVD